MTLPNGRADPRARGEPPHNTPGAALQGASFAFGKPPVNPKPPVNTYAGNNGALVAASRAGSKSPQPISRQSTGGSYVSNHSTQLSSHLTLPQPAPTSRSVSPSYIAANLAAARNTPTVAQKARPKQWSPRSSIDRGSRASSIERGYYAYEDMASIVDSSPSPSLRPQSKKNEKTDDTPIPATSSLVKMFEQEPSKASKPSKPSKPIKKSKPPPIPEPLLKSKGAPPPIKSPKPRRTISLNLHPEEVSNVTLKANDNDHSNVEHQTPTYARPTTPAKKPPQLGPKPKPLVLQKEKSQEVDKTSTPKQISPTLTRSRSRPQTRESIESTRPASSASSYTSAQETQSESKAKAPAVPPPRRAAKPAPVISADSATSLQTPTKPKTKPKPKQPAPKPRVSPPELQDERRLSLDSDPIGRPKSTGTSAYARQNLNLLKPHITGDSLANAMVGASLAASRKNSPASKDTLPVPSPFSSSASTPNRQHHHHHHFFQRTPSPQRRPGKLKHTMRGHHKGVESSSESDEFHKKAKKIFGKKAPNKHHEGTRRRWRDKITESERKRYEGVWASNKGMHMADVHLMSPTGPRPRSALGLQQEVLNIVVRDIWSRSRLPEMVLEEVWDLVDTRGAGRLTKEEFVVGMWLIDQRLKGRKLPTKVQESVWGSVRGAGVKIRVKH